MNFLTVVIGGLLAIIGTLIVLNLRSIKHCLRKFDARADKQDEKIEKAQDDVKKVRSDFTACKVDCERSYVKTDLFLRETGFQRRALENLSTSVNRLDGKLSIVEKFPEIFGDIFRSVVKEMNNGVRK